MFVVDQVEPQAPASVELTDMLENDLADSLASDFIASQTPEMVEKLPGNVHEMSTKLEVKKRKVFIYWVSPWDFHFMVRIPMF